MVTMGYMKNSDIWAEFSRRKVQFHKNEDWKNIRLWGLFSWGAINRMIKDGRVLVDYPYKRENQTVWCRPSPETYEKHIKPLIENYTLDELLKMSGWVD
jgi:hypothetical protein